VSHITIKPESSTGGTQKHFVACRIGAFERLSGSLFANDAWRARLTSDTIDP
jgi:hypothetical protein